MNMNYAKPLRKSDNIGKSPGKCTVKITEIPTSVEEVSKDH